MVKTLLLNKFYIKFMYYKITNVSYVIIILLLILGVFSNQNNIEHPGVCNMHVDAIDITCVMQKMHIYD